MRALGIYAVKEKRVSLEIGVNLYSARVAMEQDPDGTLAGIAKSGYHNVETAGYYGLSPANFQKLLETHGLRAVAAHIPIARFDNDLDTVIAEAKMFGLHSLVVPWLSPEQRQAEFLRELPAMLNAWGKRVVQAGMRLAYHNHDFEYQVEVDGRKLMNLLVDDTHPDFVDFEPDLYWIAEAGHDPAAELERLHPRVRIAHAKDRARDGSIANVGSGIFDWKAIIAIAKANVIDFLIVENDFPSDVQADLAASFNFLHRSVAG
jgi:sugar phosphate isomerase/epimerase